MAISKTQTNDERKAENSQPSPQEVHNTERLAAEKAHEEAEHDIAEDPDFSMHSPNDDLDEGETARLGEDNGGLI
jgi:hypothetical protein